MAKKEKYLRNNPFVRFHHKSWQEKTTYILFFIFFVAAAMIFIFPLYSTLQLSLSTANGRVEKEIHSFWDFFSFGPEVQTTAWANVVDRFYVVTDEGDQNLLSMLWNSIWFTFLKVSLSLIASTLLAYAVAKFEFPGKKLLFLIAIFVQTIPIFGSGASSYKLFDKLNMINNPLLFWMAWCTGFDFTFIIMHGCFTGISNSYSESAKIDGANNFTILLKVIVPMVAPVLLALFISNSVGVWNDYSTIQVYLRDYPTLAYGLYAFQTDTARYVENSLAVQNCATLISCVPIIIIYACSQKLILTNISVGGLKG